MDFSLFLTTFINVLVTLFYIIPGFLLKKSGLGKEDHLPTVSAILLYIGTPFMVVNGFIGMEFSWDQIKLLGLFFVLMLFSQALFLVIIFLVCRKKFEGKTRVISIAAVCGNVGFFGLPVIRAIFPDHPEVVGYSVMYMMAMNLISYTIGQYFISGDKKYASIKTALINPAAIGLYVALPLYFFNVGPILPTAVKTAIASIANITAPLCMFILGIRLASAPIKDIFTDKAPYIGGALKLLVYPLLAFLVVRFLPVPQIFKASALILSSVPCANVILSLAEMHHNEMKVAANTILLSTVVCFITIPLLTLLLSL